MSTTVDDELDRDDVVNALRRDVAAQPVRPIPVEQVTGRGRRRRTRRRASVAAISTAAVLLVGAMAVAVLGHGQADRVRTADAPPTETGPGIEPLLVLGTETGHERELAGRPPVNSAALDLLDATGRREPWWRPDGTSPWATGAGIVLADGRRIASAQGAPGGERDGQLALLELDERGGVRRTFPLDVELPQGREPSVDARIVGATGSKVDVLESQRTLSSAAADGSRRLITVMALVSIDIDTGEIETILDDLGDTTLRTAGDRIVSVRYAVSTTEPCLLDVRDRDQVDAVRTVAIACDAPDSPIPPMVDLVALDPTGRYAVVERTTLTTGTPDMSLLIVDLDGGTTTEVATVASPLPWTTLAWDAGGTLRLAMPTDDPGLHPIDVPSPAGGPPVEVVRYRTR